MAIKVFQLPSVNNTTLFNIRERSYLWQGKVNPPVYLWVRMVWEFHQKIFVETRVTRHSSHSLKLQGLSVSASPCIAFSHEGSTPTPSLPGSILKVKTLLSSRETQVPDGLFLETATSGAATDAKNCWENRCHCPLKTMGCQSDQDPSRLKQNKQKAGNRLLSPNSDFFRNDV